MDIMLVFKGATLVQSIAEYVGIIESISGKLDRITQSEFNAGMNALNQASKSNSEQYSLLREARNRFNKAVSLEKNERLAFSYLGLALCHYHLNDYINAKEALQEILKVEIENTEAIKSAIGLTMLSKLWDVALANESFVPNNTLFTFKQGMQLRMEKLEELKTYVRLCVKDLDS